MKQIRILPFGVHSGPENMARDEAMLMATVADGIPRFRSYSWTEPTLTLGYFQPAAERLTKPEWAKLAWVRRATGGAAILHDPACEITYSFSLPAGPDWQAPGTSWICEAHYLIRDLLRQMEIESKLVVCGEEQKLGPFLCFRHQTPGDLLVQGHKVAGSAQRKQFGCLLQHGSLLLRQAEAAADLPGLADLMNRSPLPPGSKLMADFGQRLADRLGASANTVIVEDEELGHFLAESRAKYQSLEWNAKR